MKGRKQALARFQPAPKMTPVRLPTRRVIGAAMNIIRVDMMKPTQMPQLAEVVRAQVLSPPQM